jgi:hypothetical protein
MGEKSFLRLAQGVKDSFLGETGNAHCGPQRL